MMADGRRWLKHMGDTVAAVDIPLRLLPYLEDLHRTGLYGNDFEQTVIRCLEQQINKAVADGLIPLRRYGKFHRWLR